MRRSLLILLLAVGAADGLDAQDPRIASRFPATEAAAISALIDSAAHAGLPREPLVLRALEGAAKGVPGPRVRIALVRFRDAMAEARDVVGSGSDPMELTTAASALLEGVPAPRLAELRALRGERSITAPLGAYLDLMARGTPSSAAWDRVAELARRNVADREFARLVTGPPPNARPQ